jgi:hypothetical protein
MLSDERCDGHRIGSDEQARKGFRLMKANCPMDWSWRSELTLEVTEGAEGTEGTEGTGQDHHGETEQRRTNWPT